MKTETTLHTAKARDRSLFSEPSPPIVSNYFKASSKATIIFGAVLLTATAPLVAALCMLVKLTSRGPALFRQVRVGKDGTHFSILKLRTMYLDAERATGPTWCLPGDSRITPLGRWLRFLHLDELPQLINVVRGEMALVGPRPERPEIIARENLEQRVPGYSHRRMVLPGVTGLAQVNLPADQTVHCVNRKVALDIEYICTGSLGLDFRILLCTALRMLGLQYGLGVKLLGLKRGGAASYSHEPSHTRSEGSSADRLARWDLGTPVQTVTVTPVACVSRPRNQIEFETVAINAPRQPR